MLSLIEVTCPHCGARGQIMLPPVGSIIVGPCPECQELVVIFCGQVLPLKKDIMVAGSLSEKRDHMMAVLTGFLSGRIAQIITDDFGSEVAESAGDSVADSPLPQPASPLDPEMRLMYPAPNPISEDELDDFKLNELKLLDNPDYFRAIFG